MTRGNVASERSTCKRRRAGIAGALILGGGVVIIAAAFRLSELEPIGALSTLPTGRGDAKAPVGGRASGFPRALARVYGHNFGTVAPSEKLSTSFEIASCGDADLHLSVVDKSCGCTRAWIDRDVIRPSQNALLHVEFHVPDHPGGIAHFVDVGSDDPDHPRIRFTFSARAEWALVAYPSEVYAGAILPDREFSCDIELVSTDGARFDVTSVECSHPWLAVAPLDDARRKRFRLTVSRPEEAGAFDARISFATSSKRRPSLSVHVRGESATGGLLWPARLVLGAREKGSEVDLDLVVQARDNDAELRIDSVKIADPDWAVRSWTPRFTNPRALVLKLRVGVPRDVGYRRSALLVTLDGAREPIEAPISCLVQ